MKDIKMALKLGIGFGIVLILGLIIAMSGWNGVTGLVSRDLLKAI